MSAIEQELVRDARGDADNIACGKFLPGATLNRSRLENRRAEMARKVRNGVSVQV